MGVPSQDIYTNEAVDTVVEKEGKFFFLDSTVHVELGPYNTKEEAAQAQKEYEQSIAQS